MELPHLLLEKLLCDPAITPATTRALESTQHKKTASKYLLDALNDPNLLASPLDNSKGSLIEQIAVQASDSSSIQRSSTALLNQNWDSILNAHAVLSQSVAKLQQMHSSLDSLEANTHLEDKMAPVGVVESVVDESKGTATAYAVTAPLFDSLDILLLPTLSNTLFSLSNYHECIQVSSLTRRLLIRYPSGHHIVPKVHAAVARETHDMVLSLSKLISTNIKQSTIIKVVSLLKRLTTTQLAPLFFASRHHFILQELDALSPLLDVNLTERYLKRCIEVVREHCFQTVATAESLFDPPTSLLCSFIESLLTVLANTVRTHLPAIPTQSGVDSLLLQLVYCAQSLSRRGGEFSTAIVHALTPVVPADAFWGIVQRQRALASSL